MKFIELLEITLKPGQNTVSHDLTSDTGNVSAKTKKEPVVKQQMADGLISKIALQASKRFWDESPLDYDPNRDVKFLAMIIRSELKSGDPKKAIEVPMKASKRFWKENPHDYDEDDVVFLADIIQQTIRSVMKE